MSKAHRFADGNEAELRRYTKQSKKYFSDVYSLQYKKTEIRIVVFLALTLLMASGIIVTNSGYLRVFDNIGANDAPGITRKLEDMGFAAIYAKGSQTIVMPKRQAEVYRALQEEDLRAMVERVQEDIRKGLCASADIQDAAVIIDKDSAERDFRITVMLRLAEGKAMTQEFLRAIKDYVRASAPELARENILVLDADMQPYIIEEVFPVGEIHTAPIAI